jgi:hypothetical protein
MKSMTTALLLFPFAPLSNISSLSISLTVSAQTMSSWGTSSMMLEARERNEIWVEGERMANAAVVVLGERVEGPAGEEEEEMKGEWERDPEGPDEDEGRASRQMLRACLNGFGATEDAF